MAKNIKDNNTLNFKTLHAESKTKEDLVIDNLREELTHKKSLRKLKDSRILKYVSEDLPVLENLKEKKFLNNLRFYEGEDAIINNVCVPFSDFMECLDKLGWVFTDFHTVYKKNRSYTRYVLRKSSTTPNSATAEEVKEALNELYGGRAEFGEATYRYAPEISYLTVIIPDVCSEDFDECIKKEDTIRESRMYKKGRKLEETDIKKFCEENLPIGETLFYLVKDPDGRYLVNEGTEEYPEYYFNKTLEKEAEAFETIKDAKEAIMKYCFDLKDNLTFEGNNININKYDVLYKEIEEFTKSCNILPIGTRKVKEGIKKLDKKKKISEAKVYDKKRDVAFFLVKSDDGKYISENEDRSYQLVNNFEDAEVYDSQEDAESAIFHFNYREEKEGVEETLFHIVDVYMEELYIKEN